MAWLFFLFLSLMKSQIKDKAAIKRPLHTSFNIQSGFGLLNPRYWMWTTGGASCIQRETRSALLNCSHWEFLNEECLKLKQALNLIRILWQQNKGSPWPNRDKQSSQTARQCLLCWTYYFNTAKPAACITRFRRLKRCWCIPEWCCVTVACTVTL